MGDDWAKKVAKRIKDAEEAQRHREEVQLMRDRKLTANAPDFWNKFLIHLQNKVVSLNANLSGDAAKPYRCERRRDDYVAVDKLGSPTQADELVVEYNPLAHRIDCNVVRNSQGRINGYVIDVDETGELYFKSEGRNFSAE